MMSEIMVSMSGGGQSSADCGRFVMLFVDRQGVVVRFCDDCFVGSVVVEGTLVFVVSMLPSPNVEVN